MSERDDEAIDLDRLLPGYDAATAAPNEVKECTCGARWTIERSMHLSPCHGRALAKLKAAHPEEFAQLFADEKASSLAQFELEWRAHLAGQHGRYRSPRR